MVAAHHPNRGPMTRAEYEALVQPGAEGYAAVSRHGRGEKLPLTAFEDVALGVDEVLPPTRRP